MAKYVFRLLRGLYQTADKTYTAKKPGYDKIETDEALDERYGADKFQRLSGTGDEPAPVNETEDEGVDLETMTNAQLRDFAESENIDLGTATRKDEMVETIRAALDAR